MVITTDNIAYLSLYLVRLVCPTKDVFNPIHIIIIIVSVALPHPGLRRFKPKRLTLQQIGGE